MSLIPRSELGDAPPEQIFLEEDVQCLIAAARRNPDLRDRLLGALNADIASLERLGFDPAQEERRAALLLQVRQWKLLLIARVHGETH